MCDLCGRGARARGITGGRRGRGCIRCVHAPVNGGTPIVSEIDAATIVPEIDAAPIVSEINAAASVSEINAAASVSEIDAAAIVSEIDAAASVSEINAAATRGARGVGRTDTVLGDACERRQRVGSRALVREATRG